MRNLLRHIWYLPRNLIVAGIILYQKTLSPDHGPLHPLYPYGYCRHHPTCSEYGKQAVQKHGCILGLLLIIRRLLTCHPWQTPSQERIHMLLMDQG